MPRKGLTADQLSEDSDDSDGNLTKKCRPLRRFAAFSICTFDALHSRTKQGVGGGRGAERVSCGGLACASQSIKTASSMERFPNPSSTPAAQKPRRSPPKAEGGAGQQSRTGCDIQHNVLPWSPSGESDSAGNRDRTSTRSQREGTELARTTGRKHPANHPRTSLNFRGNASTGGILLRNPLKMKMVPVGRIELPTKGL